MDVVLVTQPARDARAELRHDLVMDLGGALVHDEQGHVILAQLAGDGGEGGLRGDLAVEQLVGLLHDDDELARLLLPVRAELVGLVLPGGADLAGEQVRDEQVIEVVLVPAEGEHHVLAVLQRAGDLAHAVRRGGLDDVGLAEEAAELVVQGLRGRNVHAGGKRPGGHAVGVRDLLHAALVVLQLHFLAVHGLEGRKPVLAEAAVQGVEGGGRGLLEVQLAGQGFDIRGGDIAGGDLQVEVRLLAADGGARSQAHHADLRLEFGLQAGDGLLGVGGHVIEAVLVVHIQHQDGGLVVVHQPGQDEARQEGLARAGGAEDARRALDELIQVDADRVSLLAGGADDEVALLPGVPEDAGDVLGAGQAHGGVVRGHGLDRDGGGVFGVGRAPSGVGGRKLIRADVLHQRGEDLQVGVEGLPVEQVGEVGRQAGAGLLVREAGVGGPELEVGDEAIEAVAAGLDHHEAAFLDLERVNGEAGVEQVLEAAADDVADGLIRAHRVTSLRASRTLMSAG